MSSTTCNNRSFCKALGVLFFALSQFSCVTTQQDMLYLNDQLAVLNSRIDRLETSLPQQLSAEIDAQLRSVRDTQAELVAENQEIKGEIENLSGRVQEIMHWIEQNVKKETADQNTEKVNLSRLEAEVDYILEYLDIEIPQTLEDRYVKKNFRRDGALRNQKLTDEEDVTDSDNQFYEKAAKSYRLAQYERALSGFRDFLKKFPDSDLADDALYQTGLCHMALQEYEQAIIAFQEFINKYPKMDKMPGALLRQAIAFQEIGDYTASRIVLKKIVKNHENSSEAKIAEQKIKTQLTESASQTAFTEDSTTKTKSRYHVVRRGDSLYRIAEKNGVSVEKIRRLNNLASGEFIYPGQKLLIRQ
jgi:tol-pal system protein YbgF